jgi:hypothetical protein
VGAGGDGEGDGGDGDGGVGEGGVGDGGVGEGWVPGAGASPPPPDPQPVATAEKPSEMNAARTQRLRWTSTASFGSWGGVPSAIMIFR